MTCPTTCTMTHPCWTCRQAVINMESRPKDTNDLGGIIGVDRMDIRIEGAKISSRVTLELRSVLQTAREESKAAMRDTGDALGRLREVRRSIRASLPPGAVRGRLRAKARVCSGSSRYRVMFR